MTTNLLLDARQRAMLQEMGVRVWLPSEALQHAKPAQGERMIQDVQPIPVRREPPLRLPVLSTPPAAVTTAPVRYVIANLPNQAASFDCIVLGEPCTDAAEQLLANMLRAMGKNCFVAHMVAASGEEMPLADQIASLQAKIVLALGPHAAKALLGEASSLVPFGKLRGQLHTADRMHADVVITYHPMQLLRKGALLAQLKAQMWQDLKLVLKELK
jgi:DNA polymerase